MQLDWNALGEVTVVSIGATVGLVVIFAFGIRAFALYETARDGGDGQGHSHGTPALAGAGLCLLACVAAVLYGLYLIVPQFH
jgi:hypothetical protein